MKNKKLGWGTAFVDAVGKDNATYNPRRKSHKHIKLTQTKKWSWRKDDIAI